MNLATTLYIINTMLLLLHEIDSAYQEEWKILKLPGKITGFLFMHIPLIVLLLYGLVEMTSGSFLGLIFGIVSGIGGVLPFIVHKIFYKDPTHFTTYTSNVIIYLNVLSGIILAALSLPI